MNIAKKYLEQAYIGYHRIICYDLMIKGIQEDLSKFNNDKIRLCHNKWLILTRNSV